MLPVSVLLPTRDARAFLPRHVEALSQWHDLAAELVVVDSASTDGTIEFLRAHVPLERLRFLSHPPGLYESWNYGIAQLRQEWTYIATVGDTISRAGLEHLVETAQRLQSDVLLTKRAFVGSDGQLAPDRAWPIDDLLRRSDDAAPSVLPGWAVFVFAVVHLPGGNAVLGSSASNLYRTACLRELPFPTEFGHAGDAAWGIQAALRMRFAVSPVRCSTFLLHPQATGRTAPAGEPLAEGLCRLAEREFAQARAAIPAEAPVGELLQATAALVRCLSILSASRRSALPWVLRPAAWAARAERDQRRRRIRELQARCLAAMMSEAAKASEPRVA